MSRNNMGIALIGSLAITMTGCAPLLAGTMNRSVTDDVVLEKTAKYFGANRKDISVAEIDKGVLSTTYQTKYKGNLYNCRIYYGDVECMNPEHPER